MDFTETKENLFIALPNLRKLLDDVEIYVKAGNYSKASVLIDDIMEEAHAVASSIEDLEFTWYPPIA
jgi:hypothetical protein